MAATLVNSADSHVIEPADLWLSELPASLRDGAPHTEKTERRGHHVEAIYVDGRAVRYEPPGFQDRMRPPGAFDPSKRLADLDDQGIHAELLFPSVGLWCYLIQTRELAIASARVYNDWLRDTFLAQTPRYLGAAMIPLVDIDDAIGEIKRVRDLGYLGAMLPATPAIAEYNDDRYTPLWATLAETGMHAVMHIGTGMDPMVTRGAGGAIINYTETFFPVMRSTLNIVAAGVLDRHRELHLICVEGGASWLPALMERMDEAFIQHEDWVKPKLERRPSQIIREQVHATFQHDKAVLSTLDITGVESLLWGSDYPHLEGTWPETRAVLDDIFDGCDPAVREAITGGTLGRLFRVPTA